MLLRVVMLCGKTRGTLMAPSRAGALFLEFEFEWSFEFEFKIILRRSPHVKTCVGVLFLLNGHFQIGEKRNTHILHIRKSSRLSLPLSLSPSLSPSLRNAPRRATRGRNRRRVCGGIATSGATDRRDKKKSAGTHNSQLKNEKKKAREHTSHN
jgi:hypothetical protein